MGSEGVESQTHGPPLSDKMDELTLIIYDRSVPTPQHHLLPLSLTYNIAAAVTVPALSSVQNFEPGRSRT